MSRIRTFLRRVAAAFAVFLIITAAGGVGGYALVQALGPSHDAGLAFLEDAAAIIVGLYIGQRVGRRVGFAMVRVAAVRGINGVLGDAGMTVVDAQRTDREVPQQLGSGATSDPDGDRPQA